MAWRQPTIADDEFTPAELNTLRGMDGSLTKLADRLTKTVRRFVSAMNAAGYQVNQDGSIPDQIEEEVKAQAVWRWLGKDFPQLKTMQTDARKVAAAAANSAFLKIVDRTYGSIESPYGTDVTTGNWNSGTKIIGRMGPVPTPIQQMNPNSPNPLYANLNAPIDEVDSNVPANTNAPVGFEVIAGNATVALSWDAVSNAVSYSVFRGTVPGVFTLLVSGLGVSYYQDNAVANGVQYFYYVVAINSTGSSSPTPTIAATPMANLVSPIYVLSSQQPTGLAAQVGILRLGNGVASGTVAGLGLLAVPQLVILTVMKPAGGLNLGSTVDIPSITQNGFNFELTGLTDSANYQLAYVIYYQTGNQPSGLGDMTGLVALAVGANGGVVAGLNLPAVPRAVIATVMKPAGGLNIQATVDYQTITQNGFTYELTGLTDSANYQLAYVLYF